MVGCPCSMFLLACIIVIPGGILGFAIEAPSTVPFEGSMRITWLTDDDDPPLFNILIQSPIGPPESSNEFIVANNVTSTDGTFTIPSLPSGVTPAEWELAFIVKFGNDEFSTVLDSTDFEVVSLSSSSGSLGSTFQPSSSSSGGDSIMVTSSSPSVPTQATLRNSLATTSSSSSRPSSTSTPPSIPSFAETSSANKSTTTPSGAIVGGAIGGLAVLLVVGGLLGWCCIRRRRQHHGAESTAAKDQDQDVEDGASSFFPAPITAHNTPFTSVAPPMPATQASLDSDADAFPESQITTILDTHERSSSPPQWDSTATRAMSPARASSRVLTGNSSLLGPPPPMRSRQTLLEDQVHRLQSELRALRLGSRRGRHANRKGTGGSSVASDGTEM